MPHPAAAATPGQGGPGGAPLPPGLHLIDTGVQRPRSDAAYLLVEQGRATFIDTGTSLAVPRLLAALDALGLGVDAVDWVIPTHVHLDHAGGAGLLMRHLPRARLLVHPRGARHMIDPAALWAGAAAVYGEQAMAAAHGSVLPVPADRVQPSHDGQTVELAGRPLRIIHTRGHARHHHCIWDESARAWFSGDTFGLSYREFDTPRGPWILPSTTPVQFEPETLRGSVERLLSAAPRQVCLTHFGPVGDVQRLGLVLLDLLDQMVALGLRLRGAKNRHQALKAGQLDLFTASLAAHGCALGREAIAELLALDLELNAQGMAVWLDRPNA